MIEVTNVIKKFDDFVALDQISVTIPDGSVFGMVGSNGAGKSTLMRLITGIYKADGGQVLVNGAPVYENPDAKVNMVYVGDELYTMGNSNMDRIAQLYKAVYPKFDTAYYERLKEMFGLPGKKSVSSFSKGMKRQAVTIIALACRTQYIFFDETFDGLDPVMRNLVKNLIYEDICDRGATAIITSHSLRELEDICDQLAFLHKGGLVLQSEVGELKSSLFKCQVAYGYEYTEDTLRSYLDGAQFMVNSQELEPVHMMHCKKNGSVSNLIIQGNEDVAKELLRAHDALLVETVPMSLEEIFTYEMSLKGYHFDEILPGKEAQHEEEK